jgi:hypothetical protein
MDSTYPDIGTGERSPIADVCRSQIHAIETGHGTYMWKSDRELRLAVSQAAAYYLCSIVLIFFPLLWVIFVAVWPVVSEG